MIRVTLSTALFIAGMFYSYLYVVYGISGFLIAKYGGGPSEGVRGRVPSVIIPVGNLRLHLHHWLIFGAMLIVFVVQGVYLAVPQELLYGLLGGVAWQGVYCYKDWHRVVYKVPERS